MSTIINEETLQELHATLLKMLDQIDHFCRENDIPYFLDSGSALGAVRHHGFIPWDDDIDIGMMREDYNRFVELALQGLPGDLVLQNELTEKHYYLFYSKVRKQHTVYPQNLQRERFFSEKGIQIDIFPFDYVSDDERKRKKQADVAKLYRRIAEFRLKDELSKKRWKWGAYYIMRLIPTKVFRRHYEKIVTKYNDRKTNTVASFTYRMARKKHYFFPTNAIIPVKDIMFENHKYMIMNDPHYYLKTMYGDYMHLPPEEKRVCHIDGEIIFNTRKDHRDEMV